MSDIPVGEVITLEWPVDFVWAAGDVECVQRVWRNGELVSSVLIHAGKPPPTGILTVHEGRVGGIPLCTD
jgi:hypothetical protein